MKTLLAILLCALSATGAHVTFTLADFTTAVQASKLLKITPLSTPTTSGSSIITSDRRTYTNDASGVTTVSNMVAGSYRCELSGAFVVTSFQITIPETSSLINASDYISTTASAPTASNSWSIAVSDMRYVLRTNGASVGLISTNTTNYGIWKYPTGASANYVWTSDANGSGSWAAAGSGSTLNLVTNYSGGATGLTLYGLTTNAGLTSSRAVVTDANKAFASSAVTATEIGYLSGVTVGIQTNLDYRVANNGGLASNLVLYGGTTNNDLTASRVVVSDANKKFASSAVTSTELAHLSGATGGVQTNVDARVPNFSGNATNLVLWSGTTNQDLTASRAMVTDANKKIASSAATATEVGYLSGVTALIQPQIDARPVAPSRRCDGRLTLTSGTPVTTADVKSAATIYFTPYLGNTISLYTGTTWSNYTFTELSASLSGYNRGTNWDVFVYDNSGTLTLDLTQWSSDTARATAIATQDGVSVKTGALTRRLVGTIRTSVVGGCEDSVTNRFVSNLYNRAPRKLQKSDATASWTYTTATWRSANNAAANRVEVVITEAGPVADIMHFGHQSMTVNSGYVGVGYDRTNGDDSDLRGSFASTTATATCHSMISHYPAVGYHFYQMVEIGNGSGVNTWYGTSGNLRAGLLGWIQN